MSGNRGSINSYIIRRIAGNNYLVYIGQPSSEYIKPICLNDMGANICELLIKGLTVDEVVDNLNGLYDTSVDTLREDVSLFLEQLVSIGISV